MIWQRCCSWFTESPEPSAFRFGTRGLLGVPSLGAICADARKLEL